MEESRDVLLKKLDIICSNTLFHHDCPILFCNAFFVLLTLPFSYQSIPSCFFLLCAGMALENISTKLGVTDFLPVVFFLSITIAVPVTAHYISANTIFNYAVT